ncbi:MAG TPA: hypothetical protein VM869_35755 [Enhygromyxa sp.]|jgi:hypothetical protein|nr:hypothetical protein [Enhygromyxa sp.]
MALDPIAQTTHPIPLLLRAIRGDSLLLKLRLYSARTGRPIVLTGYSGTAAIRKAQNSTTSTHEFDIEVDQAAAGQSTTGLVTIELDGGDSITWLEDGFWSLVLTNGSVRKTILSGPWELRGPAPGHVGYACGLCPVPGLEVAGVDCDVSRHGYAVLKLPAPQPVCGCNCM